MVEHFRTALRAVVAADDTWRAGTMARSSAEYAALEAACCAAGLSALDARRMLAAGAMRERARAHFPWSDAWHFYMGDYGACMSAAQAMEAPHG